MIPRLVVPVLLLLATACGPALLEPPDESQADPSGVVPVVIYLGDDPVPADSVRVFLQALDGPAGPAAPTEITSAFSPNGDRLEHTLGPADLDPGRTRLFVEIGEDDDPQLESVFSWEPEVDAASAGRCDPIDTRMCLFPFPNDHFTRVDPTTDTGRRLDLALVSMPTNAFGNAADPSAYNESDGFSIGSPILTHVPGIDLARTAAAPITDIPRSLTDPDHPVLVIDADTAERIPVWTELDDDVHAPDPADKALIVRPGVNFRDGRRYIVALRNLKDASGATIPAERGFQIYRDRIPTFIPEVEARRDHMEGLFDVLEDAGVERDAGLYRVWDFTVQSTRALSERLLHMRDESFESLDGEAPAFVVESVDDAPGDPQIRRDVQGTYQVPQYLTGDGSPGSRLTRGPDLLPFRNGSFTARFRCRIPQWVLDPAGGVRPARASLYGHGLFGTQNEVTNSEHVGTMANEHGFVFCSTRWVGMDSDDTIPSFGIILDFSRFPQLPERLHQGQLNQLFLARLMKHPEGFVSHPAFRLPDQEGEPVPVFDHREVFYDGNSQGGIQSGALAAFSQDIERFVMGVPGMNYSTLLKRSVDFDPFNEPLAELYDPLERELLIAMAEILWERVEANGHVYHMVDDTYPDTPPKTLLFHVAFADHQVSIWTAEIWARSIGAKTALPPAWHPDVEPLWGIDPIPFYPFEGSALVYWDSGNPPPPTGNVPPRDNGDDTGLAGCAAQRDQDPHECPRRQPEARLQKALFLDADGAVVDTCGGAPCIADNND